MYLYLLVKFVNIYAYRNEAPCFGLHKSVFSISLSFNWVGMLLLHGAKYRLKFLTNAFYIFESRRLFSHPIKKVFIYKCSGKSQVRYHRHSSKWPSNIHLYVFIADYSCCGHVSTQCYYIRFVEMKRSSFPLKSRICIL